MITRRRSKELSSIVPVRGMILTAVICCVIWIGGSSLNADPGGGLEDVTLLLNWDHQFQFAGYYAAVEKGFYREAGLTVKLDPRNSPDKAVKRILNGTAQYAVSYTAMLICRLNGKPVVALAAIFQHSPVILITRRESGVSTPADLVGKRVMMAKSRQNAEIIATLLNEGIALEQLNIIDSRFEISDYLDPTVDAISAYLTDQPFLLQQRGIPVSFIKPSTYGIDFYGDCLFTSEQEIKDHPERVQAFRTASLKGWEYAMKNVDEMVDIIKNKYHSKLDRIHLYYEAEVMRQLLLPDLVELGHMNPGRWKHIADTFVRLGMAKSDYSLDGFLYNPNPPAAATWIRRTIVIALAVALAGLLGVGVLVVFNNRLKKEVAMRKVVETNLRTANEEALAADRAKSEFLAKMSHEIRTPMNGVIGMTGLLLSTNPDKEQQEYIESIRLSGENLLRIINDILDFSKIESGNVAIEESVFKLGPCIEAVFKIIAPRIDDKKIQLHYHIEPGVPVDIKTDVTRLKQVLINLVGNAVKFTEKGDVRVMVHRIAFHNDFQVLQFEVKDSGIGIPPEKTDRLFRAFSQVDAAANRRFEGTGLGLAISRQLVHLMGGHIQVESTPGKGSVFSFTIKVPTVTGAVHETAATVSLPASGAQKNRRSKTFTTTKPGKKDTSRILVAEDNPINQRLIMKTLEKMGFTADLAPNGFEVLVALEKKRYDLILMDIQMPGMDGLEATQEIRKRERTQHSTPNTQHSTRLPIIALTANAIEGDREKYLAIGMDDYISKPMDNTLLKEKINQWSRKYET